MKAKMFEVRDEGTYIPVIALDMTGENEAEQYMLRRDGYFGQRFIALMRASGEDFHCTSASWGPRNRTFTTAHKYIEENFDALESGAVVDVFYILGETDKPKESERFFQW